MVEKTKDMDELIFYENLKISLENVLRGKTTKEEYNWGVNGDTGFKIWRAGNGAVVSVRRFKG